MDAIDRRERRERLIRLASWWSGWCTDHDEQLPALAQLGGFLLDVKDELSHDRPEPADSGEARWA